ncbi:unnamed protein product [Cylindrotheca closterium]|uniref:Uncharacterized protein n=1 Tax=Cylindrotheca closterium TaxID=2856 RepID=A0AAD2JM07_9STRA|nr:unnamed protein product [Cylindrotheca closterium]
MNNQSSSSSACSSSANVNSSRTNESSSLQGPSLRSLRASIRRRSLPNSPPMFSLAHPADRPIRNQREILNAALAVIHADGDLVAQLSSSSSSNRKLQRGGPPRQ